MVILPPLFVTVPQATHSMSKFGGSAADVTEWRPEGHSESDKVEGWDAIKIRSKHIIFDVWLCIWGNKNP